MCPSIPGHSDLGSIALTISSRTCATCLYTIFKSSALYHHAVVPSSFQIQVRRCSQCISKDIGPVTGQFFQRTTWRTLSRHTAQALIEWLNEVDSMSLQQSVKDLDKSYQKFFKEKKGFPKFKSKKNLRQSYRTNANKGRIEVESNRIRLPNSDGLSLLKVEKLTGKSFQPLFVEIQAVNTSSRFFVK